MDITRGVASTGGGGGNLCGNSSHRGSSANSRKMLIGSVLDDSRIQYNGVMGLVGGKKDRITASAGISHLNAF